MKKIKSIYEEIMNLISKKEAELYSLSLKVFKNDDDLHKETYLKGEISSLYESLNIVLRA